MTPKTASDPVNGAHSRLGPSGAHRWRRCAASLRASAGLPDTAGEEAHQGTAFHHFAALSLESGIEPHAFVGHRLRGEDGVHRPFTDEMASKALPGLDLLWAAAEGADLFVEQRVDLSRWLGPGQFGTADAAIVDVEQRKLTVFDWKWGAGVPVDPVWNDQAILYALGVWATFAEAAFDGADIAVDIIIEQPRAAGGGGVWSTTMEELLAEGENIRRDAEATHDPEAPFTPGLKQCQFCPAARHNVCRARTEWLLSLVTDDLDEDPGAVSLEDPIDLHDRRTLTPEQRSNIILNTKAITGWLTQLYEEALNDAAHGRPTPGLKRVRGRAGPRMWIDDAKAEILLVNRLGENAWQKKLLSPAQVEEEVGRKTYREKYAMHAHQTEPAPSLVPLSNPKPALLSHEQLLFEEPEETDG